MAWKNPLWGALRGEDGPALRRVFESLGEFTVNPTFSTITVDGLATLGSLAVTSTATFSSTVRAATRITIPASDSSNLWNIDNLAGTLRLFRENYAASGAGGGGVVRLTLTDAGVLTVVGSVSASGDITNTNAAGNVKLGGWSAGSTYRAVESAKNHVLLSHATDNDMYLISDSGEINLRIGVTDRIIATAAGATVAGSLSASTDVAATNDVTAQGYMQAGPSNPFWRVQRVAGTLDGAGAGNAAHGISEGHRKVILAQGWYRNSSASPYARDFRTWAVDGTHMYVSGGLAGQPWRGIILYTEDNSGW